MINDKVTIFLVDDDSIFLKVMETQFKEKTNFNIKTFSTGEACLEAIAEKPNIVFLDYNLDTVSEGSLDGLGILDKIKAAHPEIEVVMLSAQDNMEIAVKCMKHNAFDYIVKSETAFMKAQKAVISIFHHSKLTKEVNYYKNAALLVSILIGLIVIVTAILKVYHPDVMDK